LMPAAAIADQASFFFSFASSLLFSGAGVVVGFRAGTRVGFGAGGFGVGGGLACWGLGGGRALLGPGGFMFLALVMAATIGPSISIIFFSMLSSRIAM